MKKIHVRTTNLFVQLNEGTQIRLCTAVFFAILPVPASIGLGLVEGVEPELYELIWDILPMHILILKGSIFFIFFSISLSTVGNGIYSTVVYIFS